MWLNGLSANWIELKGRKVIARLKIKKKFVCLS